MAITQSIVAAVVERIPDRKVVGVRVAIGTDAGVVADSVRFCFDLITEDTNLAGAELEIDQPPGAELRIMSVRVARVEVS
jgi:hydrogenase nickel incorporation protein HypA/HybF